MGVCESENNAKETDEQDDTSQDKSKIKEETFFKEQPIIEIDPCIANISKSLCFIQTESTSGSGFLIKLFKGTQDFFCLITCEHVVKREMVIQRQTINFFYDSLEQRPKQIVLNPNERLIQDFRNPNLKEKEYDIDAIVIEILPKDYISKEYFLKPDIGSIHNFINLEKEEIAIIQYPKGKLSYTYGKIKKIYKNKYEFAHLASTKEGSSGSPIFLKDSTQVIGIHKGGASNKNFGEFIGPIFDYFLYFTEKKEPWNKYIKNKNEIKDNIMNDTYKNKKTGNININFPNNIQNNQLNQMTIIYKVDKKYDYIEIFGSHFVSNNKNNCYLIINGKQMELCDDLNKKKIKIENNHIEIKLIENKHITNMYGMFSNCSSLLSFPNISKWNLANVINVSHMFENCRSLVSLPDISDWNTTNVTSMSHMFCKCSSLISLPDISKWNLENVINMSHMFENCSSLISLPDISDWNSTNVTDMRSMFDNCSSLNVFPDISKWNTTNVTDMYGMFSNCISLISLPDISKWNTINVTDMGDMFYNYKSSKSFPDISKWNTANVINMYRMFGDCSSLIYLPDISKWNTTNVKYVGNMFSNCSSLISLPDISKWNLVNAIDTSNMFENCSSLKLFPDISKWNTAIFINMSHMFYNCSSLISLPDISQWYTINVINMSHMFYKCSSLISLPDISKWNTTNVTDMSLMFCHCSSLISLPDISKWNTTNVTDMGLIFCNCSSLVSLPDISKWNITNVNCMWSMFFNCSSLKSFPNISKWKFKKEFVRLDMFKVCDERIIPEEFKSNCLIY